MIESRDDEPVLGHVKTKLKNPDEFLERIKYLYEHKEEKSREEIELLDGRIIDRFSSPMYEENGRYFGRIRSGRRRTGRRAAFADERRVRGDGQAVGPHARWQPLS